MNARQTGLGLEVKVKQNALPDLRPRDQDDTKPRRSECFGLLGGFTFIHVVL